MFGIIRLVFWAIVFLCLYFKIKKSQMAHKKRYILLIYVIISVLWTISGMLPIENAFITFSSPESAYRYVNFEEVKLVVQGNETALVIGQKDAAEFVKLIIPKSDEGWKVGRGLDIKLVNKKLVNEVAVCIYQYRKTNDYYVEVTSINDGGIDIVDNRNSKFYLLEDTSALNEVYNTYYAYVDKLDDAYLLKVNGNAISFGE